jgi:tetratricopeptide (TPR) repeat protein
MNLNSVSARKIASYYTPQREAFEQYLRGIHESSERSERTNALALVHLKKAIQLDSVYVPALNFLAHLLEERYDKKWDESDQILQEAALYCRNSIRLDSSNSGATAMLGVIEFLRNNDSSAIALSESALRLNPNNLAALTNLGTIYIKRLNQPETGVTYFKKAQELEPLDWSVYSNLGVGYANMGNLPEAYRMWQTALRLDSSQVDVWINLGEYYLIEAKHDSAVLCFRRALAGSPLEASLYGRLATVLLSRREFAEAEQILTNGVNTLQQDVELLYLLGVTYQLANKMQEGKNILQQGRSLVVARLKNKPGDAELISTQGLFEARRGNQQAARRFATSAAAQDAHNVEVMIRVARIYSILGDKPKMLATFSAARAEDPNLDVAYLRTALDFERFRTDPDLLAIARGK